MMNQIKRFFKEEEGQGMTEYGLILGLVALGAIAGLIFLGDEVTKIFENIKEALSATE
ncbi:MAG: Flp family type IVb pilin [Bacillaceae bacterium]|nr:Flp family type IVb pilin [Bacillaceae bacterium]